MNAAGQRLARPAEHRGIPPVDPGPESSFPTETSARPRIVLVEDSLSDAYLVRLALDRTQLRAELTHFSDSDKALEWFACVEKSGMPDLLILDLNMPRKDGFEILAALKKMPELAEMPVMILTSSISPEDRRRAVQAGVRRFMSKPMMLNDFLGGVGATVEQTIRETGQSRSH